MSIYRRGRLWSYHFHFRGAHIQCSTGLADSQSALDAEAIHRAQLAEGRAGIRRPKPAIQFSALAEQFREWAAGSYQDRPNTAKFYNQALVALCRYFGVSLLEQITPTQIEQFKLRRHQGAGGYTGVSKSTVNRELAVLRYTLNLAEDWGYHLPAGNPVSKVAMWPETPGRMRVVTRDEEVRYLASASQPLADIATVMLETGMRPEEVFRLELQDINLAAGWLFNPRGKTPAARRRIPLSTGVLRVLAHRAEQASVRGLQRYLFPNLDWSGHVTSVRAAHNGAVARAEISPGFVLYDLRHTFATRAVEAGVELPVLAALLGHTKISMSVRYAHPSENAKIGAIRKMESHV